MDFFEVGIYLMIVIVAGAVAFGIMWMMMRAMRPKRARRRRPSGPVQVVAGKQVGLLPQGNVEVAGTEKTEKRGKRDRSEREKGRKEEKKSRDRDDSLPKLKDLPDERLLPEVMRKKQEARKPAEEKPEAEARKQPQQHSPGSRESEQAAAQDQAAADLELPDLPSLDTMVEEEEQSQTEEVDLSNVFEIEEEEDSATSDLAANLFDVDLGNIEKLSSEVSEYLNGMRSK
jgi:hypothetical protein